MTIMEDSGINEESSILKELAMIDDSTVAGTLMKLSVNKQSLKYGCNFLIELTLRILKQYK